MKETSVAIGKDAADEARDANARVHALMRELHSLKSERDDLRAHLVEARKLDSLGCLAGGVIHDFNNMLMVILGCSELALERVDHADAAWEELTQIRAAAVCASRLTRQLLGYLRHHPAFPEEFDLNEHISGNLRLLRRMVGDSIGIEWRPGPAVGRVRMEPLHVDRMLINLCANARDAMKGRGTIHISTQRWEAPREANLPPGEAAGGECALLTVADDGCGMDPREQERLFTPLYTTKEREGGTGLGLATVSHIAQVNRGRIAVESGKGKGTTFRIYLPVNRTPHGTRPGGG